MCVSLVALKLKVCDSNKENCNILRMVHCAINSAAAKIFYYYTVPVYYDIMLSLSLQLQCYRYVMIYIVCRGHNTV
jgi:hypothetical protein